MSKRIPESTRIQQINEKPNCTFVKWVDGYKNNQSKAICVCDGSHEWSASVNNLVNNDRGCPFCSDRVPLTEGECNKILSGLASGRYSFKISESFAGNKTMYECTCLTGGHVWIASFTSLKDQRTGCKVCSVVRGSSRRVLTESVRLKGIIDRTGGSVGYERVGAYIGGATMYKCKCYLDGHAWESSLNSLARNKRGCTKCMALGVSRRRSLSESAYIEKLNEVASGRFSFKVEGVLAGSITRVLCKCLIDGHEWDARINNIMNGKGCPCCADYGYSPSKVGTLYALQSDCGTMMKIGISNKVDQRHSQLKKATPFDWTCIGTKQSDDGAMIASLEKEMHQAFERIEFTDKFDGHTEWFKFDSNVFTYLA